MLRAISLFGGVLVVSVGLAVPASAGPLEDTVCGTLRQYPGMGAVDVALMLSEDRAVFYSYDAARWAVDSIIAADCPELAR